jgi:hypothetical protein
MIRQQLIKKGKGAAKGFRRRGGEEGTEND